MVVLPPTTSELGDAVTPTVGGGVGADTATSTVRVIRPPGPSHVREKVLDCVRLAVVSDPATGFDPLHPPAAVQEVALLLDQLRSALPPGATCAGVAVSVSAGAGGVAVTAIDAVWDAEPPGPVQEIV